MKTTNSYLSSLLKQSLFYKSKQRKPSPPKIKSIDLDFNRHGHVFQETGKLKPGRGHTGMIKRVWTCSKCGLVGVQHGLQRVIALQKAYTNVSCPEDSSVLLAAMQPRGKVKIIHPYVEQFGFKVGDILDIVSCPSEDSIKYGADVWVFSTERKEPVRLLRGEYSLIN